MVERLALESTILKNHWDWALWIQDIEIRASEQDIWQFIDPDQMEPTELAEPPWPDMDDINSLATAKEKFQYEVRIQEWNKKQDKYNRQKAAIASLRTVISQTVSPEHRQIVNRDKNVHSILKKLRDKLKPSEWETHARIRERWTHLIHGWNRQIPLDEWLNQWIIVYDEARDKNLYDIPEERAMSDFLLTIEVIDPHFPAQIKTERRLNHKDSFSEVVNRLRMDQRMRANHPLARKTTEAYVTFRGQDDQKSTAVALSSTGEPSSKLNSSGKARTKKCPCGSPKHRVSKCWFINEDQRPEGWEPSEKMQKHINEVISKDPNLQRQRDQHRSKKPASTEKNENSQEAYFVTPQVAHQISAFFENQDHDHPLRSSFILDSGATGHVVNMRDRFIDFQPTPDDENWNLGGVGADAPRIYGTGTAYLTGINQSGKKERFLLSNAAYVPGCPLNLVCLRQMERKGVQWDMAKHVLKRPDQGGRVLLKVHPTETHYLLEDNCHNQLSVMATGTGVKKSALPQESEATAFIWHQRLGHPGDELLQHLHGASRGARIIDIDQSTIRPGCEDCKMASAPKQISRRPMTRGERPWQIIHFDIIFMNTSWDGYHDCFIHFYCPFSHYHEVRCMASKGDATAEIKAFHQLLQNKGFRPEIYHTDGERSLGLDFRDHGRREGIEIHQTPPHNPEQNGMAERAGGVITNVARSIRITARLPEDLWPLAIEHAAYLLNRRPIKSLSWMSPYEKVFGIKPDLSNLRIFGCKAYRRLSQIPKLDKLEPRAETGYFVGVQASNIFKIWHPQFRSIVVSRDVEFDEKLFFDSDQPIKLLQSAAQNEQGTVSPSKSSGSSPSIPYEDEDIIQCQYQAIFENQRRIQNLDLDTNQQESRQNESERSVTADRSGSDSRDETIQQSDTEKMDWTPTYISSPAESPPDQGTRIRTIDHPIPQPHSPSHTPPGSPPNQPILPSPASLEQAQPSNIAPTEQQSIQPMFQEPERQATRALSRDVREQEVAQQRENYHQAQLTEERRMIEHDQLRAEQTVGSHRPAPTPARRNEVSADLDPHLIIEGPRNRKQKEAYQAVLNCLPSLPGYFAAFAHGITYKPEAFHGEIIWHRSDLPKPPETWSQMLRLPEPHRTGFLQASYYEYKMITQMGTWTEVPRQESGHQNQILPLKWVWSYKFDSGGNLVKYKARICVRGDLQDQWISFSDTYAATLSARLIRCLLALAAVYGYRTNQRDMVNAFLNACLDYVVFVEFPPGIGGEKTRTHCLKLFRALYGLKQAPRLWQKEFAATLRSLGLQQSSNELCLFQNQYLILFFFVDDVVTLYRPEHETFYQSFWSELSQHYAARDMGQISWFLGMRVIWDYPNRAVHLCQDSYIEKVANRFHLAIDHLHQNITPLPTKPLHKASDGNYHQKKQFIHLYQQKVGSALYTALITRPDAAFAAVRLSCFMNRPTIDHMGAVDRLIQYLYTTRFLAIRYSPINVDLDPLSHEAAIFTAASDAAFADNPDRKSSEGFLFKLYGGPIDWSAKKQRTVTTSTTEAELLALSEAAKQLIWWHRLFHNICFQGASTTIDCDNRQTVRAMIHDEAIQTRLRHVDIRNHWLRQEHQEGRIHINWIPTTEMPADGLTKALDSDHHSRFIQQLGLTDVQHLIG